MEPVHPLKERLFDNYMKFNVFAYDKLVCDLIFSGMTDMEISEKYKHLLPTPEEVAVVREELYAEIDIDNV